MANCSVVLLASGIYLPGNQESNVPVGNYSSFILRLWVEPNGGWRWGLIQHVATRKKRRFSTVSEMLDFISQYSADGEVAIPFLLNGAGLLTDAEAEAEAEAKEIELDAAQDSEMLLLVVPVTVGVPGVPGTVVPPPPPQLGYAPRQSTQIGSSIITFGRQNVSMQIGGMQNRNRDDVRRERCRPSEIWYGADQTGTAGTVPDRWRQFQWSSLRPFRRTH